MKIDKAINVSAVTILIIAACLAIWLVNTAMYSTPLIGEDDGYYEVFPNENRVVYSDNNNSISLGEAKMIKYWAAHNMKVEYLAGL